MGTFRSATSLGCREGLRVEEEPALGLRGGQPGREEMVGPFLPVDPAVSGQELALVPMAGSRGSLQGSWASSSWDWQRQ